MTRRPEDLDMRSMLPPKDVLHEMIDGWIAEDVGRLDITTEFLIPVETKARFVLNTRDDVVICGIGVAAEVFHRHVPECTVEILTPDGTRAEPSQAITGSTYSVILCIRIYMSMYICNSK